MFIIHYQDWGRLNRYEVVQQGSDVAVIALGDFFQNGEAAARLIEEKQEKADFDQSALHHWS